MRVGTGSVGIAWKAVRLEGILKLRVRVRTKRNSVGRWMYEHWGRERVRDERRGRRGRWGWVHQLGCWRGLVLGVLVWSVVRLTRHALIHMHVYTSSITLTARGRDALANSLRCNQICQSVVRLTRRSSSLSFSDASIFAYNQLASRCW